VSTVCQKGPNPTEPVRQCDATCEAGRRCAGRPTTTRKRRRARPANSSSLKLELVINPVLANRGQSIRERQVPSVAQSGTGTTAHNWPSHHDGPWPDPDKAFRVRKSVQQQRCDRACVAQDIVDAKLNAINEKVDDLQVTYASSSSDCDSDSSAQRCGCSGLSIASSPTSARPARTSRPPLAP
jgi:hypothetical protein